MAMTITVNGAMTAQEGVVLQPKPRFFYNDDGGRPYHVCQGPFHIQQLYDPVDVLVGTGVTTLCYCVGYDMVYYPSAVASQIGWRETHSHRTSPVYAHGYRVAQQMREQGIDIIEVIRDRAAEKGLEFVPSLRMNDGHFTGKVPPTEHPLTSEFWMEHQDLTIQPNSVLDFSHQEVRDYRLAQIREIIEGYATDGFEMDFTRHYLYFPPGQAKPELLTDLVRQARALLDEREQRVGKKLMLIVRVADSLAQCQQYGTDVVTWMKEGLVDYVVPSSPSRYASYDMPIEEFLQAAEGTDCKIVASPDSCSTQGPEQSLTPAAYRGLIANYYAMGQEATYLFNFFCTGRYPFTEVDYALLRDLSSPVTLHGRDKQFMATHESWHGPALPQTVGEVGVPAAVSIFVGDDVARAREENILAGVQLRVRLEGYQEGDTIEVALNAQPLDVAAAQVEWPSLAEFRAHVYWPGQWDQQVTQGPFAVLTFDLSSALPQVGENTVSVTLSRPREQQGPLRITGVDIFTHYNILGVEE